MMKVTGSTQLVGLFGYPVTHTASPAFQNAGFEALGLDWLYLPLEVRPEDLKEAVLGVKALGFAGVNCTIPHKETVIQYLDDLSPEAEAIGAVNTIHISDGFLHGYNTDGIGFMWALREIEQSGIAGKRVFVMGTGGAGRAIAVQSAIEKAGAIMLCDMDEDRAESLADHIKRKLDYDAAKFVRHDPSKIARALDGIDVFIDSTPLGMHENDPVSTDTSLLAEDVLVADLVYRPPETPLLKKARERGCRTMNGLGMLLHQGAKAFELWTGQDAPVEVMRKALEAAVYGPETN